MVKFLEPLWMLKPTGLKTQPEAWAIQIIHGFGICKFRLDKTVSDKQSEPVYSRHVYKCICRNAFRAK